MLTLALTIFAAPTQAASDPPPVREYIDNGMPMGAGKSYVVQKPFLDNGQANLSYPWTADLIQKMRQKYPSSKLKGLNLKQKPFLDDGGQVVDLSYPWTADLVQEMRQKDSNLKLTGLNLSGFEGNGPNELATHLRVSDGYYHLVTQDYPVDLDRIHGRCELKPSDEICPGFDHSDGRLNRNRFNMWGPYYIRQTRNEKGALITNIIARSFAFMDFSKLTWKYFTFGDNDYAGNYAQLHANTIHETLTGIEYLHNHPEKTTLMLSPGAKKMEPVSEKPGYVENEGKQLCVYHLAKTYKVTDPLLKQFKKSAKYWGIKPMRRRLLSRDEERIRKHEALRRIHADE